MNERAELAAAAKAARPAAAADPPLLTGGSGQETECVGGLVVGRGIDFLTATMGMSAARMLMAESRSYEDGFARQGFERSEQRLCIGGKCWRRWKPRQESKRFGREYESWEWSGGVSDWAAKRLRSEREVKPTRVDIAWDVAVPDEVTADRAWDAIAAHVQRAGLTGGISGQAGINTRYVGSTTSTARVRIYRKDLQDKAWSVQFGRTLRMELVLKAERAEAWWKVFAADPETAFAAAAGEIERMTGLVVQQQRQELPQQSSSPAADEGYRCVEFLRQYGPALKAWQEAGLPIGELASEAWRQSSRNTKHVAKKRVEAIRKAGVEQVIQFVLEALGTCRNRTA